MKEATTQERKLNQFWFIWNLVESILLFAGGVLSIVAGVIATKDQAASSLAGIENIVAYLIAGFALLDGLLRIILFLVRYKTHDDITPILVSAFEITLGILFILLQARFTAESIFTFVVSHLVSILLMVSGTLLLTLAIFFIVKKATKVFIPALEIIFAAILIGVGVLIEVLYNTNGERERMVLIMTGIIVILAAIAMFVTLLINRHKLKKGTANVNSQPPATVPGETAQTPASEPSPETPSDSDDAIEVEARDTSEPPQIEEQKPKRLGRRKK